MNCPRACTSLSSALRTFCVGAAPETDVSLFPQTMAGFRLNLASVAFTSVFGTSRGFVSLCVPQSRKEVVRSTLVHWTHLFPFCLYYTIKPQVCQPLFVKFSKNLPVPHPRDRRCDTAPVHDGSALLITLRSGQRARTLSLRLGLVCGRLRHPPLGLASVQASSLSASPRFSLTPGSPGFRRSRWPGRTSSAPRPRRPRMWDATRPPSPRCCTRTRTSHPHGWAESPR